jgi:hypothetical protein
MFGDLLEEGMSTARHAAGLRLQSVTGIPFATKQSSGGHVSKRLAAILHTDLLTSDALAFSDDGS